MCVRCSALITETDQVCRTCGAPHAFVERGRYRPSGLAPTIRAASLAKIALATMLDLLVLLGTVGLGAVLGGFVATVTASIIAALAQTVALLWWGRTAGWWAIGIRLVARETGSAPGFRGGALSAADTRRGPDPIDPFVTPPAFPTAPVIKEPSAPERVSELVKPPTPQTSFAPVAAARPRDRSPASEAHSPRPDDLLRAAPPDPPTRRRMRTEPAPLSSGLDEDVEATGMRAAGLRAGGNVLVIDGERRVPITARMSIGRNPAATGTETPLAIPDLARELSKSHLLLEQDSDGFIFVTDLRSTNGTYIDEELIEPGVRVPVSLLSVVNAGGHTFQVRSRTHIEQGASA